MRGLKIEKDNLMNDAPLTTKCWKKQNIIIISGLIFIMVFVPNTTLAQGKNSSGGFLDFNIYPHLTDVETDNIFTLNTLAKLPNRFSYFSLLNLSKQSDNSGLGDTVNYYTEQNLRWQISENSPFDLTMQLNFRSGEDNDRYRFGMRWRLNNTSYFSSFFKSINTSYSINFHVIQFDHEDADVWQMEHVLMMKFPYISNRLYLAAFADHTFNQDLADGMPSSPIVAEAQLGYRVADNFFLIAEYRLNQYRRSDVNNLAIGLQYKMIW